MGLWRPGQAPGFRASFRSVTISVVIPTLDEAPRIADAVECALDAGPSGARGESLRNEVVVVDGGSRDETVQIACESGARVYRLSDEARRESSPPGSVSAGRARQLRFGSEKTRGEVILFLHADTRLPAGWSASVERALSDPGCAGGAFRFRFAERGGWERWIEFWVNLRVTLLRLPYGDQALFVRRSVLEQMGGVAIVPIMEDLDLVRGMKRAGRLARLSDCATTSSRRYRARGPLRTIFWHQVALLGWALGWDREGLATRMGR